ncbi:hypothetical protein ACFLYU_01905 [Candidatus Dependentiae bacterium]
MKKNIQDLLGDWPQYFIRDVDLAMILGKTDDARYSIIKRATKAGLLIRIKRGLYLIARKAKTLDEFELALYVYSPSFVSLESALSYHGWIPEAVYTTTCVSTKRAKEFKTPVGVFSYKRVPADGFYNGVDRIVTKKGAVFIATPWRALADFMYINRRSWENLAQLSEDLRIDMYVLIEGDKKQFELLIKNYPSCCVRENLKIFKEEGKK